MRWQNERAGKRQERSSLGDGDVLCHNQGDGYMGTHICENTCTLRMGRFIIDANHISIKFIERKQQQQKKRALESNTMNKASRGDGIPAELVQILKDDAVKFLQSIF